MAGLPSLRELEFDSIPENINLIESLVQQLTEELLWGEEMEANILVSLSEAVNNAILHGNRSNPSKKVKIVFLPEERSMSFSIEDEGEGFDDKMVKDPTAPENLDKPSGRGIFLMRNLADQVEYFNNGRKVVITFFRN